MKEFVLFVDSGTQQRLSTEPQSGQESNVLLAKVPLNRLDESRRQIKECREIYVQNMDYLLAHGPRGS